eukprot:XP_001692437.1 predicted protein [Chlamydomonas reinhardtii]
MTITSMVELLTARACALCLAYFVAMFAAAATSSASPAVKYVSEREGWQRAWTHEAMEPMYKRVWVTGLTFEDFNPAFRIRVGYCLVPMFSPVKEVRPGGKSYNEDLLVPHLAYPADELVEVEPADKIPRAGIAIHADEPAGSEGSCRWFVRNLNHLTLLYRFSKHPCNPPSTPQSAYPAPAACLARYQVALSCDSQAANPGLAGLLASNSLVLKGRSNWAEYYYRLLKDGEHYIEFDSAFATEVVKEAMLKSQAAKCAAIVERAQRFAYTYLSQRSRALFYEKAITEYNKLFGEGYMQATVADLPRDRPLAMSDILALPIGARAWGVGLADFAQLTLWVDCVANLGPLAALAQCSIQNASTVFNQSYGC